MGLNATLTSIIADFSGENLNAVISRGNDAGAKQIKNVSDPTSAQDAATKHYVDNSIPSSAWGSITGTLSNQTDLQTALNAKANSSSLGALASLNSVNNSNWSGAVLSVGNGGTGTNSPGLIQGSNITISGSWPNQTINASASPPVRDTMGDANYVWASGKTILGITAALTAPRTITLPAANSLTAGTILYIVDEFGGLTATNYATLTRASSDTINGLITLKVTGTKSFIGLQTDGTSKWTMTNNKLLYQLVTISTSTFTFDFQNEEFVIFENTTAITANCTVAFSNNTNARSFEFKFKINGANLTMTCPSTWTSLSSDINWNSSTQVYTFNGTNTNLFYNVSGTYNVDRAKWEVVFGQSDFV